MINQEGHWILSRSDKVCPLLRKRALKWYQVQRYVPCFTQRLFAAALRRWQRIPVIVQVEADTFSTLGAETLAKSAGCIVGRKLPVINAFSTLVNEKSLKALVLDNHIAKIWYDAQVRAVLDVASPVVRATRLWQENITGSGVAVAVLDTGIYSHPDLAGRIAGFVDFVNNRPKPYDDNGHGTHVAGDVASAGELYRGPAPGAQVVGVKVLNKVGSGSLSTVIEGIQWCINNKDEAGIRVLNLSLGSKATLPYQDDPVCQAVEKAWLAGLVVCAAAGNAGPDPGTVGSPGNDPLIITVGALDDQNTLASEDDRVAPFSSRGPTGDGLIKPDVLAPGVGIVSLRSPGSFIDKQDKASRVGSIYTSMSGTSMATPVCAGIAALLLEQNSSLSPHRIKEILMQTASRLPGLDVNIQGAGLIDGGKALELLQGQSQLSAADPVAVAIEAPSRITVISGRSAPCKVRVLDQNGTPLSSAKVIWSLSPSLDGKFQEGVFEAGRKSGEGVLTLAACSDYHPVIKKIPVAVEPGAPESITIDAPESMPCNSLATFTANGFDINGNSAVLSNILWTVKDGEILDQEGNSAIVRFTSPGRKMVAASLSGLNARHELVVFGPAAGIRLHSAPGPALTKQPFDLTVTVVDRHGNAVRDFCGTISFSSSDKQAELPESYCLSHHDMGTKSFCVSFGSAGENCINAYAGDVSGSCSVFVLSGISAIKIIPSSVAVKVHRNYQLTAVAEYSDGTRQDITDDAKWEVADSLFATVQKGLVTGMNVGETKVTARLKGISGHARVKIISVTG